MGRYNTQLANSRVSRLTNVCFPNANSEQDEMNYNNRSIYKSRASSVCQISSCLMTQSMSWQSISQSSWYLNKQYTDVWFENGVRTSLEERNPTICRQTLAWNYNLNLVNVDWFWNNDANNLLVYTVISQHGPVQLFNIPWNWQEYCYKQCVDYNNTLEKSKSH